MTSNITFAKGEFSVTIDTVEITDNYNNKLMLNIPNLQTKQKQSLGPVDKKIVDLLWITHELVIRGSLETTQERDDLIKIFEGGEVTGTPVVMTYDTHPDTPLNVFISKLMIKESSRDKSPVTEVKYEVQITLIEGVSA